MRSKTQHSQTRVLGRRTPLERPKEVAIEGLAWQRVKSALRLLRAIWRLPSGPRLAFRSFGKKDLCVQKTRRFAFLEPNKGLPVRLPVSNCTEFVWIFQTRVLLAVFIGGVFVLILCMNALEGTLL